MKKKTIFKKIFGKTINIWDIFVLIVIIVYIYKTFALEGYWGMFNIFASAIFFAYIVSIIMRGIKNKVKK